MYLLDDMKVVSLPLK